MANILQKAIKIKKKEFKLRTRILGLPKGHKLYFLKRDGMAKPWTILAVMDYWNEDFSKWRSSKNIQVAAYPQEQFTPFATTRTMMDIASLATHIAIGGDDQFMVYAVRNGDDWKPYFMDWTYTFFVIQISDRFVPADNIDVDYVPA